MSPDGEGYAVGYLPSARRDLVDIVGYVACDLKNPDAADRLASELVDGIESLARFPYRRPVYLSMKPLGHEVRSLRIANYLAFYWIDEDARTVTIARVLYARADVGEHLSDGEV